MSSVECCFNFQLLNNSQIFMLIKTKGKTVLLCMHSFGLLYIGVSNINVMLKYSAIQRQL